MRVAVCMVIFEEDSFVCEVAGESDGGYSEAGEGALEAVPSGEGPSVPPSLTAKT